MLKNKITTTLLATFFVSCLSQSAFATTKTNSEVLTQTQNKESVSKFDNFVKGETKTTLLDKSKTENNKTVKELDNKAEVVLTEQSKDNLNPIDTNVASNDNMADSIKPNENTFLTAFEYYLKEHKKEVDAIKQNPDFYIDALKIKNDELLKLYRENKTLKEQERETFISNLKHTLLEQKADVFVKEQGFPFTNKPIYIYKNLLIEMDVTGTVQIFKSEDFLLKLLLQWNDNELLKYLTFDEANELFIKKKFNEQTAKEYTQIINEYKVQQQNIIGIDFNKRPELKRILHSILKENGANAQNAYATMMSIKFANYQLEELKKEHELLKNASDLLKSYNKKEQDK